MKQQLILLTGIYRLNNLYHIAKSITLAYEKYKSVIDLYWCICIDQYNSIGSCEDALKYMEDYENIKICTYYSGQPNQENYGGDLYNIPLYNMVEHVYKLDDPWVYVLDDDNIIHPLLFDFFLRAISYSSTNRCMVIPMLNEHNVSREMYIDNVGKDITRETTNDNWIYINYIPDPSCVILKYSLIKENNYFDNKATYDMKWLLPLICDNKYNCTFYDYLDGFGEDRVYSYHNGLRTIDEIDDFINSDIIGSCEVILSKNDISYPILFPILSDDARNKIMQIVKEDLIKFKR